MTASVRNRAAKRRASRADRVAVTNRAPPTDGVTLWPEVQRAWWALGAVAGLVATLGFQTFSPSRRLSAMEAINARQDSTIVAESAMQRQALDTIRRQLGQLLAGQCAKERDRMARLLYECR